MAEMNVWSSYTPQQKYDEFKSGYRWRNDYRTNNYQCNTCGPNVPPGFVDSRPAGSSSYTYTGYGISTASLDEAWDKYIVANGGKTLAMTQQEQAALAAKLAAEEAARLAAEKAAADAAAAEQLRLKNEMLASQTARWAVAPKPSGLIVTDLTIEPSVSDLFPGNQGWIRINVTATGSGMLSILVDNVKLLDESLNPGNTPYTFTYLKQLTTGTRNICANGVCRSFVVGSTVVRKDAFLSINTRNTPPFKEGERIVIFGILEESGLLFNPDINGAYISIKIKIDSTEVKSYGTKTYASTSIGENWSYVWEVPANTSGKTITVDAVFAGNSNYNQVAATKNIGAIVFSCSPSWDCETPLNGYEKDGCGNRRLNAACNPPTPPGPASVQCPEGTTRTVKCPKDPNKTVTQKCVNGTWVTLPADETKCEENPEAMIIVAAVILIILFFVSRKGK